MRTYKATRFIIDRIDKKLGSVEKEISFDKAVILACLVVIAAEGVLILLSTSFPFFRIPALVGVFFAAFGIFLIPVMTKELKDDQAKADQKESDSEDKHKA